MSKINVEMKMPSFPNYLQGKYIDISVDVGAMTDEETKEFISKWGEGFLAHVTERRKSLSNKD